MALVLTRRCRQLRSFATLREIVIAGCRRFPRFLDLICNQAQGGAEREDVDGRFVQVARNTSVQTRDGFSGAEPVLVSS
jgi:hypothetical protein